MIVLKPMLSSDTAMRLTHTAVAHARANGWTVAVAVVDGAGNPLASWRMDDAPAPVATFAQDKAYTAAVMKKASADLAAEAETSLQQRMGIESRDRLLVWSGGLPIWVEGQVVGAIGVSGAKDIDDIACAQAALTGEGLSWERAPDSS